MSRKKSNRSLYHPLYWPIWGLFALARLVVCLPYRWLQSLGRGLGLLLLPLSPRLRHNCLVNYRICFPTLSVQGQQQLLRRNYQALGIAVLETMMSWWRPQRNFYRFRRDCQGWAHLQRAFTEKIPTIL